MLHVMSQIGFHPLLACREELLCSRNRTTRVFHLAPRVVYFSSRRLIATSVVSAGKGSLRSRHPRSKEGQWFKSVWSSLQALIRRILHHVDQTSRDFFTKASRRLMRTLRMMLALMALQASFQRLRLRRMFCGKQEY